MNKQYIDCIEIDFENQAVLRELGYNVIDGDFLSSNIICMYSHIIMNPPFQNGVDHVLKAWDSLYSGEIVAVVNAETIKNPFSVKRKQLCKLIEDHGEVEFYDNEFLSQDTKRKTSVEIALIWLEKIKEPAYDFTNGLESDNIPDIDFSNKNNLVLRDNNIGNIVLIFNNAVEKLKQVIYAEDEFVYYSNLLGKAFNQENTIDKFNLEETFNTRYTELQKKAWTNILNSTEFRKYLSSKTYNKLVSDFDSVSKSSFTENNIRGFLLGLVNNQSDMNLQMLLDCFDEITKYKTDNRAYYCGWKSNDKHKTQAYRVKMTRFILPTYAYEWQTYCPWEFRNKLADFDKVFAMLDGKSTDFDGYSTLEKCISDKWDLLCSRERISTEYFDIRYYKGKRSMHFFPTRKDLIDRLNRMVGKERSWLPQDDKASKSFWKQYDDAEKITSKMVINDRYCGDSDQC
ncbi:MAG: DUF4942 domain-containing protein [Flavobacterium sp.]|uniref:DUF4942 domain-containing protein n=1 Tax=Flavobacterium sp. TaxID=239 RepID=UPI00261CB1D9|nr:DUF4942 domain-containing protein [Flavobacterium sp.]MDD5151224.1 DUF4942 domain-containing protein [Flavobacterium sp.]